MPEISGISNPTEVFKANIAAHNGMMRVQDDVPTNGSFGDIFTNLIQTADDQYNIASEGTESLLSGETDNLAQVMIDSAKAETSLNTVIQIRNRVLDAYNEVMRMSL